MGGTRIWTGVAVPVELGDNRHPKLTPVRLNCEPLTHPFGPPELDHTN
jgi:hypothetical protein